MRRMDETQAGGGIRHDTASKPPAHFVEPGAATKNAGEGTDWGLAAAGRHRQHGGIRSESQLSERTNFERHLPAAAWAGEQEAPAARGSGTSSAGSEVILLVEDDDMVRMLAREILEGLGYVVHEALNGRHGLALCEAHKGPIDLLLTDVMMPELGGRELAEGALKLRPGVKVLFMSGLSREMVLQDRMRNGIAFLQKPFMPADLAQKVRETLDSEARSAARA